MSYFRSDYQVQIKKNFIESIKSAIQNPGPDPGPKKFNQSGPKNLGPDGLYRPVCLIYFPAFII